MLKLTLYTKPKITETIKIKNRVYRISALEKSRDGWQATLTRVR
jgi:hypothetical protein